MAVTVNPIDAALGIYSISSVNDEEPRPERDATTGGRYASNYMGARSRWWDLSHQQALLETEGIEAHNKRIDRAIDDWVDAKANIIQGIPGAANQAFRFHSQQDTRRREFNAGAGDRRRTSTRIGGGSSGGGRGGQNTRSGNRPPSMVRDVVDSAVDENFQSVEADARALSAITANDAVWDDDVSQNQLAWTLIGNRAAQVSNNMIRANPDMTKAEADAEALLSLEQTYANHPDGRVIWGRYQEGLERLQARNGRGPNRVTTVTTTQGDRQIQQYADAQGNLTTNPFDMNPFMFDQEETVNRIDREILELESQRMQPLDLIGRTREINREKFGPGIFESIRNFRGDRARMRQERGQREQVRALLEGHLRNGGTLEEFEAMISRARRGEDPIAAPAPPQEGVPLDQVGLDEIGVSADWSDEHGNKYRHEDGKYYWQRGGVGDWEEVTDPGAIEAVQGVFTGDEKPWEARQEPTEEAVDDNTVIQLRPAMTAEDIARHKEWLRQANVEREAQGKPLLTVSPSYEEVEVLESTTEEPGRIETALNEGASIEDAMDSGIVEPAAPVPRFSGRIVPGAVRPLPQEPAESRLVPRTSGRIVPGSVRPLPQEPVQEEVTPTGVPDLDMIPIDEELQEQQEEQRGEDTTGQRHALNLLEASGNAAQRLKKPDQFRRQVANADDGSPAAFARAQMDAFKAMDPQQRPAISDMVSNLSQQYNELGDSKGRNEAVEYLMGMYQLETNSTMLT